MCLLQLPRAVFLHVISASDVSGATQENKCYSKWIIVAEMYFSSHLLHGQLIKYRLHFIYMSYIPSIVNKVAFVFIEHGRNYVPLMESLYEVKSLILNWLSDGVFWIYLCLVHALTYLFFVFI